MVFMTEAEHDAITRHSFERQVGLFVGDDAPFARRPELPTAWVEPLDEDMLVLDVACGAAHVAEQIAPRVRQVVGIDLTAALLAAGAERLRDAGLRNVLLQEGNAARLPFVDGSFDLVVCRTALHHFPEAERATAEMARVCKPRGRVVAADMTVPNASVRDAFDAVHRDLDPSHVAALTASELTALLESHVGDVTRSDPPTRLRLPIESIVTEAADRDRVFAALHAELAGGPMTGFDPTTEDQQIVVSFQISVVEATRRATR
jgi:SAM-dependent methyltransferase